MLSTGLLVGVVVVIFMATFFIKFYPISLLDTSYQHVFTRRLENSVDSDQLASDLDLH